MINELVFKKAKDGDGDSLCELIQPIKESMYKVALTYTENEDDALDCVHESIVKAIKSLKSLKTPQYFNTWMIRITINTCKDFIRKNKVMLVDINDYQDKLTVKESSESYYEDVLLALSKLNEDEKDLIVKRYLDDMSLREIADSREVPLGTIKSKISRTLKKLRIHMEENNYEKNIYK